MAGGKQAVLKKISTQSRKGKHSVSVLYPHWLGEKLGSTLRHSRRRRIGAFNATVSFHTFPIFCLLPISIFNQKSRRPRMTFLNFVFIDHIHIMLVVSFGYFLILENENNLKQSDFLILKKTNSMKTCVVHLSQKNRNPPARSC